MTKNGFFHFEKKQRTPGKVPGKVTRDSLHCSYYPNLKQLATFWGTLEHPQRNPTLVLFSKEERQTKRQDNTEGLFIQQQL